MFSDEVGAFGGAHTQGYITVKEDGDNPYNKECVANMESKLPAWMFQRVSARGKRGLSVFWENAWGRKFREVRLRNLEKYSSLRSATP